MAIKVGINGFGRIGRMAFRAIAKDFPEIEVVAINDLLDPDYLAYMLKFDSVHGRFNGDVSVSGSNLVVNGKTIRLTAERDPTNLKWNEAGADIVIECTGFFLDDETCQKRHAEREVRIELVGIVRGKNLRRSIGHLADRERSGRFAPNCVSELPQDIVSAARMRQLIPVFHQVGNRIEAKTISVHVLEPVRRDLLHFLEDCRRFVIQVGHSAPEEPVVELVAHRRFVPHLLSPRRRLLRLHARPPVPAPVRTRRIA